MTPQRFFSVAPQVYEQVRLSLDSAWGHGPGTGTLTCVTPDAKAPHDSSGRTLLAVRPEFCEYDAVAAILPQLLASGLVQEIDRSTYIRSMPPPPPLR